MKRGPAPVNDVPEGAIALKPGSRLNTMNVGATHEPEVQIQTCPEGFCDQFGRTLWYTIEGTGGPVTIDTAGSNIDTLIGVYAPTDAGFEEVACIDDVEFEPVGSTYQAALTIDTEEGVTYYVQIGGYRFPFDEAAIGRRPAASASRCAEHGRRHPGRAASHDPGLNTISAITIAKLSSSSRETRKSRFIRARPASDVGPSASKSSPTRLARGPR